LIGSNQPHWTDRRGASNGYREEATKYHEKLADAVTPYRGTVLKKTDILKILIGKYAELTEKEDWILPSDHCRNRTNDGACYCAKTDKAIFDWSRGGNTSSLAVYLTVLLTDFIE